MELLKLAPSQKCFANLNPNIIAATRLLRPFLKSPLGQAVISFVVGYYATTKLAQIFKTIYRPKDKMPPDDSKGVLQTAAKAELANDGDNLNLPNGQDVVQLTLEQLTAYDGVNVDKPIYTALNGKIYDLSPSREKFGCCGQYSLLAGCDANQVLSIACGSMGVCTSDVIQCWEQSLNAEFNIIGYLIESDVSNGIDAVDEHMEESEDELCESGDESTVVEQLETDRTSKI